MKKLSILTTVVLALFTTDCSGTRPRPIVIQGAMDIETSKFTTLLTHVTIEKIGGWTFWHGDLDGYPVIISKTLKGMENTAAATTIAADHFHPIAIINQGTAGGHDPQLHVYDIVLGKSSVNIGAFKTAPLEQGQGSDFAKWRPMDLMASEGSAGNDPNARTMRRYPGDEKLLAAANSVKSSYHQGQVVEGIIASSEMWNSEFDRIRHFHELYGTSAEEMETAAAAQIAGIFNIPFLGIRILSNNITNGGAYDSKTGEACQDFVYAVVKSYIAKLH